METQASFMRKFSSAFSLFLVGNINLRRLAPFTEEDFLHDFRMNALGAALALQAALPALKKSLGSASIVLFSSVALV